MAAVPSGTGGFLIGSYMIKRLAMSSGPLLRAMFFLAMFAIITTLMFTIQCDAAPLADIPTEQHVDPLHSYDHISLIFQSLCPLHVT